MGFIDTVKGKVKATADAFTGKAATVALATNGQLIGGQAIDVTLTVTSTGNPLESKAAYIDLHGEDDVAESLVEKARELVMRERDPHHTFEVHGPFTLAAGETKTLMGRFTVPLELDMKRRWFVRGRVQAFGNDPDSPWTLIS